MVWCVLWYLCGVMWVGFGMCLNLVACGLGIENVVFGWMWIKK